MNLAFGLIQTAITASLLVYAFRAHERFWTLGFLGWRKVYTGLVLSLLGGLAALAAYWSDGGWILPLSSAVAGGLGLALVLAGSIERLHDLARERRQLEDVRAGYDLFDTLREVAGGAYAFLEVLDFALKEMVRASGAAAGGLWLYNPAGREWVLTGAAGMSQAFRKQTESVRGSGTGFDRLAHTSKARVFSRVEEIRLFFPEWEAEGYRSILGLPLLTGAGGAPGASGPQDKQRLGIIVLADQVESRFDDDRARRLHAAADYVAAVVAEARLQRQVEAAQKRSEAQAVEAETRLQEAERRQAALSEEFAVERGEWEQRVARLREDHESQLSALKSESAAAAATLQAEFNERLAAAVRRHEELHAQWQEVHQAEQKLRESLDAERREWTRRSEEWQRQEATRREEWEQQRAARETQIDQQRTELAARDDELSRRSHAHEEQLQGLRMQAEELQRSAAEEQRRLREELQSLHAAIAERERHVSAERDAERGRAREDHDRLTSELQSLHALLAERERQVTAEREDERRRQAEQITESERQLAAVQTELSTLREQLAERRQEIATLRAEIEAGRRDLAEAHEKAERRQAEMAETHAGQLEAERETARRMAADFHVEREGAAGTILRLEEHLGALREESDRALAHWSEEMEAQRQLSRQRLDEATEKLGGVESVIADLLAVLSSSDPFDAILARIQDRLPQGSELWLWRRLPDAKPALLAIRRDAETRAGDDVSVHAPWRFEADTIPAEGVTIVPDAEAWNAREEYEDQYHRERWDEAWGKGQRPSWAVCWPWAGSDRTAGENGWLTAFGFGPERPPDHRQIELLSIYAGAVGALVMRSLHPSAMPAAEPRSETGDRSVSAPTVEESVAGPPSNPDMDLHAAVIAWVADQKDDEWRLDLGAPVPPLVNERWLAGVLDAVRASCRNGGDGTPNRFAIETRPSDGGAQLRLANQSLAGSADDVVSHETSGDDSTATVAGDPGALHCRWLTSGGHRIGVEITFPDTASADLSMSPAPLQVLVADDQPPMAELLAGMLQSLGHNAVTCGGAQEAYSRFVTERFDVVITSGTMPQDTGLALAGWIKSHNPTTPVILLAEPGGVSVSEPGEPCWDRTLEKPFHIDQLQDVLRSFRHGACATFLVDAVSAG